MESAPLSRVHVMSWKEKKTFSRDYTSLTLTIRYQLVATNCKKCWNKRKRNSIAKQENDKRHNLGHKKKRNHVYLPQDANWKTPTSFPSDSFKTFCCLEPKHLWYKIYSSHIGSAVSLTAQTAESRFCEAGQVLIGKSSNIAIRLKNNVILFVIFSKLHVDFISFLVHSHALFATNNDQ